MSFFIRDNGKTITFGGMQSIELDYSYYWSEGAVQITDGDTVKWPDHIWIIGSAVKNSFLLGKLKGKPSWNEDELTVLVGDLDCIMLAKCDNQYTFYRRCARTTLETEDGFVRHIGCTTAQVDDALRGIIPTRWNIQHIDA